MLLPSGVGRVVHSILELGQTQPLNKLPNRMITLFMSSDRISQMKNGFPGLDLLERSPWRPCWFQQSILLPLSMGEA